MNSNISKIRERLGMSSQHFLCYCCSDGNHGCHSAFCQSRIAFFIFSCIALTLSLLMKRLNILPCV